MKQNTDKRPRERFLRKRLRYWFDNRMAKGSLSLIRVLIIASVLLALLIACAIIALGFNEEGETASVFWNSIATVINAWMPYFEEGSPGYLILMSVTAIAGVLFTSVLIGIVTSAIEERINDMRRGNSTVVEKGHVVVLGFYPGEYTLLRQLILSCGKSSACIVVGEDMEREEMEQGIRENVDVPKNVRIVCRTVDITDPASIEKCSIETCETVIISPTEDARTIKAILAVSALLQDNNVKNTRINAIIAKNKFRLPPSLAEAHNISTFQTNEIMAKIIAHSCTQTGLAEAFREIFNFEGSEFYPISIPGIGGMSFEELSVRLNYAVPAGVFRDDGVLLNPPADYELREDDRILVFSEYGDSAELEEAQAEEESLCGELILPEQRLLSDVLIIGCNETLPIILSELAENVSRVFLATREALTEDEREPLREVAAERGLELSYHQGNLRSEKFLLELAQLSEHILILNDHDMDEEEVDMESIFQLLHLRDIRARHGLRFNVTVEMQLEHNQNLVSYGDYTDFLVSSSMSSLILAQLAENPELLGVFREILSNRGNELYLKNVEALHLTGIHTVRALRRQVLRRGYILLGWLDEQKRSSFNLPLDHILHLGPEDSLIVLGET